MMGDTRISQGTSSEKKQQSRNRFKNGKHQGKGPNTSQSLNSDAAVPMLCSGVTNNFDLFKKKRISIACMEKYKNLGHIIMDEKYNEPEQVDTALFDLTNDPFDIEKTQLKEADK
jgi:hypothetical protein